MKQYHVCIMTSNRRTLYTGVTNHVERRVNEHRQGRIRGFTKQYNIRFLVYYETWPDIRAAIVREKQIKAWTRAKRVALIESANPQWRDLSEGWYDSLPPLPS